MADYSEEALFGRWVHSHEEDGEGEMVFRPATHPLPPSRGRQAFELRPDGSFEGSAPGPDDRPAPSSGSWALEGDTLVLESEGDRPNDAWEIAAAEDDRLTLRRSPRG